MSENALPRAGKKKSKWKVIVVLLLVILAGGGGAGYYWWQHHLHNATQTAVVVPPPIPIFLSLETFTVNLINPSNDPDRVLYIGLTLRLPDDETRKVLGNYLPAVRSRLLLLLSRQDAGALSDEQGKQHLIEQIKQVLSEPLVPGQPRLVIDDVLFTAFILR